MKKGFTLIEMLAVVGLLAVIFTITVMSISGMRKNSINSLYREKIVYIESGAKSWGERNLNSLNSSCTNVRISTLINEGYIIGDNSDKTELTIPGTTEIFNDKCVCVKYENTYSGKDISSYGYKNINNYQVVVSYGEGEC